MPTLFGLPVLEIAHPSGKVVPYLIRVLPVVGVRPRVWILTKGDGTEYRVEEVLFDYWRCNCNDAKYRQRFGRCKHVRALIEHLESNQ